MIWFIIILLTLFLIIFAAITSLLVILTDTINKIIITIGIILSSITVYTIAYSETTEYAYEILINDSCYSKTAKNKYMYDNKITNLEYTKILDYCKTIKNDYNKDTLRKQLK